MPRKASGMEQLEVVMERLKRAKTAAELRAAQAIVLPLALGLSLERTALAIGRSVGVSCRMRTRYDPATGEEKKAPRSKRELRNRTKASRGQEARILDEVLSEAATGGVVIVPSSVLANAPQLTKADHWGVHARYIINKIIATKPRNSQLLGFPPPSLVIGVT